LAVNEAFLHDTRAFASHNRRMIDPTAPDPYAAYAELRARGSLIRDPERGLWMAARAGAVSEVLRSNFCRVRPAMEPVPAPLVGTAAGAFFARLVRQNDGVAHATLRPLTDRLPGLAGAAREAAARWSRTLYPAADLGGLPAFARALPVHVVGSLVGLGDDVLAEAVERVQHLALAFAPGAGAEAIARGSAAADWLVARVGKGEPMSPALANQAGFLHQSHEATAGLIGSTLVAVARGAPRAPTSALVREAARHDSPVHNTRRFVARDGELAGQAVAAGDAVLVILAAANRDPAVNPDPDRFDPYRRAPVCFTFGDGIHACPGEAIAVAITEAAVNHVLETGVDLAPLARGVRYRPSHNVRVIEDVA
jgi:cytochrome P450